MQLYQMYPDVIILSVCVYQRSAMPLILVDQASSAQLCQALCNWSAVSELLIIQCRCQPGYHPPAVGNSVDTVVTASCANVHCPDMF